MQKNLSAAEFFEDLQKNEKNSNYWEDLAKTLGAPEPSLRAAFISCKISGGKDVVALKNLYAFFQNAPKENPFQEQIDAGEEPQLTRLQRARVKQLGKRYDPSVTAEDCKKDLVRVQNANPLKELSEADYMESGLYSGDTWSKHFGTWLSFKRAAGLKVALPQARFSRQVAKHVELDTYRNFFQKQVLPFANQYNFSGKEDRFRKIAVCSDIHDKKVDPFVWGVFLDTCKEMQPHNIILNGDIFDNYEFSRYSIDPRSCDVVGSFQFVKKNIFEALRKVCPDSQIDFIIGNHDWRLLKVLADGHPYIKEVLHDVMGLTLADVFGVHDYQINLVTKWDLDFAAHNKTAIEKELRKNYKVYYDCYVAAHIKDYGFGVSGTSGHVHRSHFDTSKTIAAGPVSWMTTPGMCQTDEDYVEGFDKSRNGFGLCFIDTKKDSVVQQLVDIPGNFVVVNGRLYERSDYPKLV